MRFPAALLIPLLGLSAPFARAESLRVPPLDGAVVRADSGFAAAAASLLASGEDTSRPSNSGVGARVVHAFHPPFSGAVARAARRVKVSTAQDTLARYALRIDSLSLSVRKRATGRRFVPPSPPEFDPATGEMSPGDRSGRMEGPGWTGTLSAVAQWTLWDRGGDSAVARGISMGASSFRGDAGRGDLDRAARELAKAVLRATPFAP